MSGLLALLDDVAAIVKLTATQIDDVAAAVAWAREHVADYGGDPDAIVLGGHSAGAWLAARVGLADAPLALTSTWRLGPMGFVWAALLEKVSSQL